MVTQVSGTSLTTGSVSTTTPIAKTSGGTNVAASTQLAQMVTYATGVVATGTTVMPSDNTIPQNTEGDQYLSLAITPTNAASTLEISVVTNVGTTTTAEVVVMGLFQDTAANAIAACINTQSIAGGSFPIQLVLTHQMTAGTTSATTFKVRVGGSSAGTITFNGYGGAQYMGGVMASRITIKEYLP